MTNLNGAYVIKARFPRLESKLYESLQLRHLLKLKRTARLRSKMSVAE